MYTIRAIKNVENGVEEHAWPCAFYEVTKYEEGPDAGKYKIHAAGRVVVIPDDVDNVFVENSKGDTVYRYPNKSKPTAAAVAIPSQTDAELPRKEFRTV